MLKIFTVCVNRDDDEYKVQKISHYLKQKSFVAF